MALVFYIVAEEVNCVQLDDGQHWCFFAVWDRAYCQHYETPTQPCIECLLDTDVFYLHMYLYFHTVHVTMKDKASCDKGKMKRNILIHDAL